MKGKKSLYTAAGIYLLLGLFLLLFPGLTTGLFCTGVGVLLLVYGGVTVLGFFLHRGSSGSYGFQAELILGVISVLVGSFFLSHSAFIVSVIPTVLGLYILIDALVGVKRGLDMRALDYPKWTATLGLSILSLLLGVFILRHPFGVGLSLWRLIGGVFLYQGGTDLWAVWKLDRLNQNL